jgi:hypothetical protein
MTTDESLISFKFKFLSKNKLDKHFILMQYLLDLTDLHLEVLGINEPRSGGRTFSQVPGQSSRGSNLGKHSPIVRKIGSGQLSPTGGGGGKFDRFHNLNTSIV